MAWVRFLEDHLFHPEGNRRRSLQFRKGCRYSVRKDWAASFVQDGLAEAIATPRRDQLPMHLRFNGAPAGAFDHNNDKKPGGRRRGSGRGRGG